MTSNRDKNSIGIIQLEIIFLLAELIPCLLIGDVPGKFNRN